MPPSLTDGVSPASRIQLDQRTNPWYAFYTHTIQHQFLVAAMRWTRRKGRVEHLPLLPEKEK